MWIVANQKNVTYASLVCIFDIGCTAMNYTGAVLAGPTIFAIVYSSVTIWTALFSKLFLARTINTGQWCGILIVFVGLITTSMDTVGNTTNNNNSIINNYDDTVVVGFFMILIGSAMHAMTYIMSEALMKKRKKKKTAIAILKKKKKAVSSSIISRLVSSSYYDDGSNDDEEHQEQEQGQQEEQGQEEQPLTSNQNNAIQSIVATIVVGMWQLVYTVPNFHAKIVIPMKLVGTTTTKALLILFSISVSNLIHSSTFFYILKYFPGGSTSAGIMKGLQAVIVFVIAHYLYCDPTTTSSMTHNNGNNTNQEMCFTTNKFIALITVSTGVIVFGIKSSTTATALNSISFASVFSSLSSRRKEKHSNTTTNIIASATNNGSSKDDNSTSTTTTTNNTVHRIGRRHNTATTTAATITSALTADTAIRTRSNDNSNSGEQQQHELPLFFTTTRR
jgi:hypothetical protein